MEKKEFINIVLDICAEFEKSFSMESYDVIGEKDGLAISVKVQNCPEGFTWFIEPDKIGNNVFGINPWLYNNESLKEVKALTLKTLAKVPKITIFFDDDGSVNFNPASTFVDNQIENYTIKAKSIDELLDKLNQK